LIILLITAKVYFWGLASESICVCVITIVTEIAIIVKFSIFLLLLWQLASKQQFTSAT